MNFLELYEQTNSNFFIVGESYHGTKEIPLHFIKVLGNASKLNKKINLFLEFPIDLQELLDNFVKNKINYKEFLKTDFYNSSKNFYDGRLSKSMFNIISFAKDNKDKINTFFVVGSKNKDKESLNEHELMMCENICKKYDENKLNLFYVGSMHAITNIIPDTWKSNYFEHNNYLPCGIHLKKRISNVISIEFKPYLGKVLTSIASFDKLDSPKLKYLKIKENKNKQICYQELIKLKNEEYDYRYCIKRATPAYKLK